MIAAAVHRNATEPFHQARDREGKQAALAHPVDAHAQLENHQQHQYEIPVAGVWRSDQHDARIIQRSAHGLPAGELE